MLLELLENGVSQQIGVNENHCAAPLEIIRQLRQLGWVNPRQRPPRMRADAVGALRRFLHPVQNSCGKEMQQLILLRSG